MIEVKNLVKKYGDHLAVNDLSFTIEPGKIYGFLGPNGAGKSTTMNIITGYLAATEGQVLINGHDITEEPEEAKKCIGIPKAKRKESIDQVVKMAGIEDVFLRLIKNLSKGYKQRVGLAQAILGFPEIIILDEPTVGLDPKQIVEIREVIKKLGKHHTVILSTHIMQEVSAVCDEVLIISKGQLVAKDTPDNLGKHVEGSNNLEVLVAAPDYKVKAILNKLDKIHKFEVLNATEQGCTRALITTGMEYDVRQDLFYACAAAKCPIVGMQNSNMSLEDVFIKVTGNDGKKSR